MIPVGFEFSRGEIQDLAQKLDSLSPQLTDDERALLLAIFWSAGDSVSAIQAQSPQNAAPTAAGLQEQILKAFIPAGASADELFVLLLQVRQDRITPPIRPGGKTRKPDS